MTNQELLRWVRNRARPRAQLEASYNGLGLPAPIPAGAGLRAALEAHLAALPAGDAAAWNPPAAPAPAPPVPPAPRPVPPTPTPAARPNRWLIASIVLGVIALLSLPFVVLGWSGTAEPTERATEVTREVVVEKEVPVTVEIERETVVEKPVVQTVEVVKEVVVEKKIPVEVTRVVTKEVPVEVVVTATPATAAPATGVCQVPDVTGLSVLGAINAMDAWFESVAWQWGAGFDRGDIVPAKSVFWTDLGAKFKVPAYVSRIKTEGNWGIFSTTQSFVPPSAGRYVVCR